MEKGTFPSGLCMMFEFGDTEGTLNPNSSNWVNVKGVDCTMLLSVPSNIIVLLVLFLKLKYFLKSFVIPKIALH